MACRIAGPPRSRPATAAQRRIVDHYLGIAGSNGLNCSTQSPSTLRGRTGHQGGGDTPRADGALAAGLNFSLEGPPGSRSPPRPRPAPCRQCRADRGRTPPAEGFESPSKSQQPHRQMQPTGQGARALLARMVLRVGCRRMGSRRRPRRHRAQATAWICVRKGMCASATVACHVRERDLVDPGLWLGVPL